MSFSRALVSLALAFPLAALLTLPAGANPWPQRSPPRAQTPHPAVARIIVPEAGGATSYGSGTLVDAHDQLALVVTNWHVVRDAAEKIEVVFPNGFRSFARPLKVDSNWDLAALVIWRPDIEPVSIAATPPRPGEPLTIAGYGRGTFRAATGHCTKYYAPDLKSPKELLEVSVQARHGDSGGPIFNGRGELAGVLFGASHGTTMGSYAGRVRGFLASVAPELGQDPALIAARPATPPASPPTPRVTDVRPAAPLAQVPPRASAPQSPAVEAEPWPRAAPAEQEPIVQRQAAPSTAVPPAAASPHFAPTEDWSSDVQLAENPPPRRTAEPAPGPPAVDEAPVAALAAPAPEELGWSDLAGPTLFDQAKTVLALIGAFAVVYFFLRIAA